MNGNSSNLDMLNLSSLLGIQGERSYRQVDKEVQSSERSPGFMCRKIQI